MNQPLLTILTPSTGELRQGQLSYVMAEIFKQSEKCNSRNIIEHLIDATPAFLNGGLSVGKKREALVKRATGKYLCFLDDDDTISPNYIATLIELCQQGQHVCSFRALYKLQNYWGVVNMSLQNKENEQATPERIIQRPPWHICPVLSEFAKQYEFKDINNAEDFDWMQRVLAHCQTEAHTDKIIFQYNHGPHSEVDKIPVPNV